MNFAQMLRHHREALNLSQDDLAEVLGKSPSFVRRMEAHKPSARIYPNSRSFVEVLAAALGLEGNVLWAAAVEDCLYAREPDIYATLFGGGQ